MHGRWSSIPREGKATYCGTDQPGGSGLQANIKRGRSLKLPSLALRRYGTTGTPHGGACSRQRQGPFLGFSTTTSHCL